MGKPSSRRLTMRSVLLPLIFWLVIFCIAIFQICYVQFQNYEIKDCIDYAKGINSLIVEDVDVDRIDEYLTQGRKAAGYEETEQRLYKLRAAYPDVRYLNVYKVETDGCHIVFDLAYGDDPGAAPGTVMPFDDVAESYRDELLEGEDIEPVVAANDDGRLLTVYEPLDNNGGDCVAYASVTFSMGEIRAYVLGIVARIAGFALILAGISVVLGYVFTKRGIVQPMQLIARRAYRDGLTDMQNKAAYTLREATLDDRVHAGGVEFAILMIDVNFLKRVNDTYGHEKGDQYLLAAADLVRRIADDENAYRFGGDEFVVLLSGNDAREADAMAARLAEEVARLQADDTIEPWQRVSAAVGAATFDPARDQCVEDVLKRADAAMYENKKAMKAERRD